MTDVSILVALAGVVDGDLGPVFDDLAGRVGVPEVVWGALPHQEGFWSVRNGGRRKIDAEPGAAYFRPDPALWSGLRLVPRAAAAMGERDLLAEVCAEAARLGLSSHVRVSMLRNPWLAAAHPGCTQLDVAGRPHPWGLCPSHPDVRGYVGSVIADLAAHGAETVRLDWLHFAGVPSPRPALSPEPAACFCRHCRAALDAWCDVDAAVDQARRESGMEPWPDERPAEHDWPDLDCCPSPPTPLHDYREAMHRPVTAIAAEAARAAESHGMKVCFTAPKRMSRTGTGVESELVANVVGHFQSPLTAIGRQSSGYAGPGGTGTICLRPREGHWTSTDDPGPSIVYAGRGGIAEVEFQHYHAMPDDFLERIGDVLISLHAGK